MIDFNFPPMIINAYLKSKIGTNPEPGFPFALQFSPTTPTDIDEFTEQFPSGDAFCVYDRMFRMRRGPFPHIKCEQVLYYFYCPPPSGTDKTSIAILSEITQRIYDLLDNGDESAQDINSWVSSNRTSDPTLANMSIIPVFHAFKIYQLEETRDIIDFGTARTWAGNKMIIDYDYHVPK